MNEIFGYCGWDFGSARNNEFQRGEDVRIGRNIYRVVFRICSDCAYYDNEQRCLVRDPMTEEERDIQIKSAKARMKK